MPRCRNRCDPRRSPPDRSGSFPTVDGISHITFIVRDLERMSMFLREGLGAREVYDSASQNCSLAREKFFVLGGVWIAAMEGDPPREKSYQHVAFAVSETDLPTYEAKLQSLGVEVRPPRSRVQGEGRSLYFYDFDNHLFELHAGAAPCPVSAWGLTNHADASGAAPLGRTTS
jgi:fosfomycin resistance protein FosX